MSFDIEREDKIRHAALSMAVERLRQSTAASVPNKMIIDTAAEFEVYLKGNAVDNSDEKSPEPTPPLQKGSVKKRG